MHLDILPNLNGFCLVGVRTKGTVRRRGENS